MTEDRWSITGAFHNGSSVPELRLSFPRILGVLLTIGALGYLTQSYGNILYPNYEEIFAVIVGVTGVIGELPFFLWLLIKGVNVQRYNERARLRGRR